MNLESSPDYDVYLRQNTSISADSGTRCTEKFQGNFLEISSFVSVKCLETSLFFLVKLLPCTLLSGGSQGPQRGEKDW